jgi:hypothetical protein
MLSLTLNPLVNLAQLLDDKLKHNISNWPPFTQCVTVWILPTIYIVWYPMLDIGELLSTSRAKAMCTRDTYSEIDMSCSV